MDDLTKLFDTTPKVCRICHLKMNPIKWDGHRWSVTCDVCKTYYEYEWLPKEQWVMTINKEYKGAPKDDK